MAEFQAGGSFDVNRDVRPPTELWARVSQRNPNGVAWPLVAARRSGKTWCLQALKQLAPPAIAQVLDLRYPKDRARFRSQSSETYLLIDEPGEWLEGRDGVNTLLDICDQRKKSGLTTLVAFAPTEWAQVRHARGTNGSFDPRDLLWLDALTDGQLQKLTRNIAWARQLVESLPQRWRQNPYLLELLLQMAESDPTLRANLPELLPVVLEESSVPEYAY